MKINCDMGESFGIWKMGHDEEVMPYLDMANIACGMHASDPSVMTKTVKMAQQHKVSIGAHPGYADLQGFGRRYIQMKSEDLAALFVYQIGALQAICQSENTSLSYVKPHGALYNAMMRDDSIFISLLKGLKNYNKSLPLVIMAVPDFPRYQKLAESYGIKLWFEAFVDRAYGDDGYLMFRSEPGASHSTIGAIEQQAIQLIEQGSVTTPTGKTIPVHVDTLCIHGDSPLALQTVKLIRDRVAQL